MILAAEGWGVLGALKLISPLETLTSLKDCFAEKPEALIVNLVFYTIGYSWLEYVDKFWENYIKKIVFEKKNQNLEFSKN